MTIVLLFSASFLSAKSLKTTTMDKESTIEGRWDLTIDFENREAPSWLEITHSGNNWLVGRYVGIVGSSRPIAVIHFKDGKFNFTLPPQWETERDFLKFEGRLKDGKLEGTMVAANGQTYSWHGVRAPLMLDNPVASWGKPVELFNGKSLDGWQAMGDNQWVVENGVLTSPHSGANLITTQKFKDFKLHIEFKCPPGSNSGIYLRGRYEVQIVDSKGKDPATDLLGAVYGFIVPSEMAAKSANEWQSYDITLVGRMITVVLNGKTVICNRPIPGITGGAIDSHEGEPGPIYLQGDHGPISFRNIVLTPGE